MNIKTENKLRFASLCNHRNKILKRTYPDHCMALKESILKILDGVIEDRACLCAADYDAKVIKLARV